MAHIVIIEDDLQAARLVVKLLDQAGHLIETAQTGEEGLYKVLSHVPDLILIDLGLPDLDGQTVISLMRQMPELSRTLMIAVTAWPSETAHKMAQAYGCDGVIIKPLNTRTFAQEIAGFLSSTVSST
ncbi:Polar-differentiation response regulator DivK [Anaerolineae bacterium]|nr:Polar-differentiation response regulator DivK [Anaerolineae bacterium]